MQARRLLTSWCREDSEGEATVTGATSADAQVLPACSGHLAAVRHPNPYAVTAVRVDSQRNVDRNWVVRRLGPWHAGNDPVEERVTLDAAQSTAVIESTSIVCIPESRVPKTATFCAANFFGVVWSLNS